MSQSALLRERRFAPFFWVQFFGAFNDNALKQAIVVLFATTLSATESAQFSNLAVGLFIAPYFFFSATAGQLAEKYEKAALIRATKLFELFIVLGAAVALYFGSAPGLLSLLTLLGLQSTLFGPVKFAILPKVLRTEELVGGNGLVEMGTYVAIIVGQIVGAELISLGENGRHLVSAVLIVVGLLGYGASRAIPEVPSEVPDLKVSLNLFSETWRTLVFAHEKRAVWLAVLGVSWFWLYGALFLTQLPTFATHDLGGTASVATLFMVVFSVGVGVGSLLCERLSSGNIELGLVPFGSIGLTVFAVDTYFGAHGIPHSATLIGPLDVLSHAAYWRLIIDFLMIGVFGGLYSVPLYALIQHRSDKDKRARIIAGLNIVSSLFLVASAAIGIVCLGVLGMSIPQLFLVAAALNAIVAFYIYTLLPEFLLRFVIWLMMHTMYRLRSSGTEHFPAEGPALLVCNHVSFVDGFILSAACKRPVRWVMWYRIYHLPILHWLFRAGGAIPIAGRREDPALMEAAFATVKKALDEGELVGIFPEGLITYNGEINAFKPGVDRILEASPVTVIPMALRGLWGSWFSRQGGVAMKKVPRRFRSQVELVVGPPIPATDATPERLEAEVRKLRGDAR
jgi:1-acyl-sn-glycerol-3-phosphate acyltransferase